jgi:hypothetical protein
MDERTLATIFTAAERDLLYRMQARPLIYVADRLRQEVLIDLARRGYCTATDGIGRDTGLLIGAATPLGLAARTD